MLTLSPYTINSITNKTYMHASGLYEKPGSLTENKLFFIASSKWEVVVEKRLSMDTYVIALFLFPTEKSNWSTYHTTIPIKKEFVTNFVETCRRTNSTKEKPWIT